MHLSTNSLFDFLFQCVKLWCREEFTKRYFQTVTKFFYRHSTRIFAFAIQNAFYCCLRNSRNIADGIRSNSPLLAKLPYRLSRRDIAEILSIISRGYSPIPYTPLLLSKNYNLRLLGIHLVRRFGIAESRSEIAVIIKERDSELKEDALSALASFGEEWSECERCKYHII